MALSIRDLTAQLDLCKQRVPLEQLLELFRQLDVHDEDIARARVFGEQRYRRNLLHAGPGYHLLVLCWKAGQRSPIHNHRGSSCAVRVLEGQATETVFDRTPSGHIYPTHSHVLSAGEICGSQDADIHQISNLQSNDRPLVTLHCYSPPLLTMQTYTLEGAVQEYTEPVFEFSHGAGI